MNQQLALLTSDPMLLVGFCAFCFAGFMAVLTLVLLLVDYFHRHHVTIHFGTRAALSDGGTPKRLDEKS